MFIEKNHDPLSKCDIMNHDRTQNCDIKIHDTQCLYNSSSYPVYKIESPFDPIQMAAGAVVQREQSAVGIANCLNSRLSATALNSRLSATALNSRLSATVLNSRLSATALNSRLSATALNSRLSVGCQLLL